MDLGQTRKNVHLFLFAIKLAGYIPAVYPLLTFGEVNYEFAYCSDFISKHFISLCLIPSYLTRFYFIGNMIQWKFDMLEMLL